jgi:hypothetical protein
MFPKEKCVRGGGGGVTRPVRQDAVAKECGQLGLLKILFEKLRGVSRHLVYTPPTLDLPLREDSFRNRMFSSQRNNVAFNFRENLWSLILPNGMKSGPYYRQEF